MTKDLTKALIGFVLSLVVSLLVIKMVVTFLDETPPASPDTHLSAPMG